MAILINEQGLVTSAVTILGVGYGLDGEAAKAAASMKFKPARKNGQPISFWKLVEIEFQIGR